METTDVENPYYGYFKEVLGRGSGEYYTGIGQIYRSRRGVQRGYGYFVAGAPYRTRRGLGIGTVLMSLFRMASPLLRVLGSKAVDVASNIAKDAIQGENVQSSAIKHAKTGAQQLIGKVPETFSNLVSKGPDSEPLNVSLSQAVTPSSTRRPRSSIGKRKKVAFKTINNKRGRGLNYPALQFM